MSEPEKPAPRVSVRRDLVAAALWWLAIANVIVAAALLLRPRPIAGGGGDGGPPHAGPGETSHAGGATAEMGGAGAMAVGTPEFMQSFVAAPPVAGRPSREALDAAIRRGTQAWLDLYLVPALEYAEGGGFLDYVDVDGNKKRLGPQVFVQCHLYLVVHLLMYGDELGIPRDHPLVQRALRFFVSTFDDEKGRWLWSEEGCLHAKGLTALARFGERERFEKGWRWALSSPMYLPDEGLFTMMQSGSIVQTLGPATRSLSGEHGWEHGAPVPDEENTGKFIYARFAAGDTADSPEALGLAQRLSALLAKNPLALGYMNTRHVVGRAWFVYEYAHWRLPPDDGYRVALAQLRAAGRGEWRRNFMMRIIPAFRSEVLRALLEAGERGDELDAIVNGFVAAQEPDGAWRVPHIAPLWGFDRPPARGYKFGDLDGANTYLVTLALIAWREHVLGG